MLPRGGFQLIQAICIAQRPPAIPDPYPRDIEVQERNPIFFGMGVDAVRTAKAAFVAAIAIVALVVPLLPGIAEESGSVALTISIDGAIGPASEWPSGSTRWNKRSRTALIPSIIVKTPLFHFPTPFEVVAHRLASASCVSNSEHINGERPFPRVAAPGEP